jgi:exopolysaccharide biosynthesis polyprenyl glycosylphosphotransferase
LLSIIVEPRAQFAGTRSRALSYLPMTALGLDILVLAAATVTAALGRGKPGLFTDPADVSGTVGVIGPFMVLGWLMVIGVFGGYKESVFNVGTDEYKRVANASLLTAGLVGVGCYLAKFDLSRGFFALEFVVGIPLLILGRFVLRRVLHRAHRAGRLSQRVLIAGDSAHIDEIAGVLSRETWLGYHILGALTPSTDVQEETSAGVPVVGNADEASSLAPRVNADVVFFAGGAIDSGKQLRRAVWDLTEHGVQVVVAPSVTDVSRERVKIRPVGGLPLMHIDPPGSTDAVRWGKRLFDIIGSLGLLLLFSPVLLAAAVRIKAADRGPVLFRQARAGRMGEEFECLKFRTMVVDAEDRLLDLHDQIGYIVGLFKMRDDPRITKPGRWLRRFSIDELPQLWNVLRGDMSLVGPRPPLPREVATYDYFATRRLQVRPGMTGLWQISGRSDLSWDETVRLDLYYVDNWSMVQDLTILAKTMGAVLSSRGAY